MIRTKHLPAIRKNPDELWDEIKLLLPPEKANKTIGRPAIPFRKVLDGIVYILRTGCQWKMLPKEYGSAYHHLEKKKIDNIKMFLM
ncbi:MAG: transposase [Nitrososphaeraceae archaeon]|nr:transposase [Nitrososphaeraceae archaeon]